MSTDIGVLRPEVRELALAFVTALESSKIAYAVTSTLRTVDEQIALYAQGRAPQDIVNLLRKKAGMLGIDAAENTYTVTKCDGMAKRSNHQGGGALDVVPVVAGRPTWKYAKYAKEYKTIGAIGKSIGFRWGGDFLPIDETTGMGWDPPHFEA